MSRREVGRYLIFVASVVVIYKVVSGRAKAFGKTKNAKDVPFEPVLVASESMSDFASKSWKSKDQKRKAKEESYWFWAKWGTCVGAGGAIVASVFAFGAYYQSRRQAGAAEAANRAWIDYRPLVLSGIDWGMGGGLITFGASEISNSGNSPALNVIVSPMILVGEWGKQIHPAITFKKRCETQRNEASSRYYGDPVFPKSTIESGTRTSATIAISSEEARNSWESYRKFFSYPWPFGLSVSVYVGFCGTYYVPGENRVAVTAKFYRLDHKTRMNNAIPFFQDIPIGDLKLGRDFGGGYAD